MGTQLKPGLRPEGMEQSLLERHKTSLLYEPLIHLITSRYEIYIYTRPPL
jgi:hypothetical protein